MVKKSLIVDATVIEAASSFIKKVKVRDPEIHHNLNLKVRLVTLQNHIHANGQNIGSMAVFMSMMLNSNVMSIEIFLTINIDVRCMQKWVHTIPYLRRC